MAVTKIYFGPPDQQSGSGVTQRRGGVIVVSEEISAVAKALSKSAPPWPRFERRWGAQRIPIHVNPAAVQFIEEYDD
jgi:hypothetical protein